VSSDAEFTRLDAELTATTAGDPPGRFIEPQLATLVGEPPSGDNWVHEIKYDGYRALCRISNGEVKLLTRSKNDWTKKFQSIADQMADLPIAMPSWTAKSLAPRNRARRRSKPCSKP
jgi:ATP-dependent DNA ligase